MKVKRAKRKNSYITGLLIIFFLFIFIFVYNRNEIHQNYIISSFFLCGAGFFAGIRAYYLDRCLRQEDNKEVVDFWTFYNETSTITLLILYFSIRPLRYVSNLDATEETRRKVNYLTYVTYLFFVLFILYSLMEI